MNQPSSSTASASSRAGRMRRGLAHSLVPLLIWGGIGSGASFAAWKIAQHSLAPLPSVHPETHWPTLPAALGGRPISVPAGAGFWLSRDAQADVLIHRAQASGPKGEVNLCRQLKNPPDELYPITLAGTWDDVRAAKAGGKLPVQRSPLVVAPEVAASMPRLVIRGSYRGTLLAEVLPGPQTARWGLAFAESQGKSFILGEESWLLWQSLPGAADSGRFDHAIRIRRLPDQGLPDSPRCQGTTEKLEWQLFTALPAAGAGRSLPVNAAVAIQGAGGKSVVHLQLASGEHRVPQARVSQMEDKVLFERAYARGLIRAGANGLAEWLPADWLRAGGEATPGWAHVKLSDPENKALHKALYRSANGEFVRDQLKRYNASQQWLGVRVRAANNSPAWSDLRLWQAQAQNQALSLNNGLPEVSARLFDRLPVGWSDWVRLGSWPVAGDAVAGTVHMTVTPPQGSQPGQRIELLVLGKLVSVGGGRVLSSQPACRVAACPAADMLTLASIELGNGPLVLTLLPDTRFNRLHPEASEGARVLMREGKLVWAEDAGGGRFGSHGAQTEVSVLARDGTALFAEGRPSDPARAMGVAELVGLGLQQKNGVAGMLGRLGGHNYPRAVATLSLDTKWQGLADQVLDCVGLRQGQWNGASRQCVMPEKALPVPERRIASLVVLDAENGDILAAAGGPHAPAEVVPADLIAFDRFNPGASRLRIHAWQHDGGRRYSPGSTFKLVDALGLEFWAVGKPERQAQLAGLTLAQWDVQGRALGFSSQAGCYPSPCGGNKIDNFDKKPASNAAREGRLGLVGALEKSVNSWFAFMVERSDGSVHLAPETLPLGPGAMEAARPVLTMAHRLGFEEKRRLDGGLLPADFDWQVDDHLQTVASAFDPILDTHSIRLQAIGQRMQATPLQMAEVTAAIATGRPVAPRLLLDLNGLAAATSHGPALGVDLTRIRLGMKAVVETGTAATAFSMGACGADSPWGVRQDRFGQYGKQKPRETRRQQRGGQLGGVVRRLPAARQPAGSTPCTGFCGVGQSQQSDRRRPCRQGDGGTAGQPGAGILKLAWACLRCHGAGGRRLALPVYPPAERCYLLWSSHHVDTFCRFCRTAPYPLEPTRPVAGSVCRRLVSPVARTGRLAAQGESDRNCRHGSAIRQRHSWAA